jgi:UDP-glucose:(heptosyl)LPS alpha-1,3-glucosyltransferase
MMLMNPIHFFIWASDSLRFGLDIHDHYVCFSDSDRAILLRYFPKLREKIRIIPNGVDLVRFTPNANIREPVRRQLSVPNDSFVMTFVGHEYERKGLFVVLEALSLMDERVVLLVAGGSEWERGRAKQFAIKHSVDSRVRFLGVVKDVENYLNASDCLVLASRFEAWPLVGLEAMACGIPALITAVGSVPAFVKDGVNGFLIERDAQDIASKVRRILDDSEMQRTLKVGSIETAQKYSWEKIAEQYIDLLASSA